MAVHEKLSILSQPTQAELPIPSSLDNNKLRFVRQVASILKPVRLEKIRQTDAIASVLAKRFSVGVFASISSSRENAQFTLEGFSRGGVKSLMDRIPNFNGSNTPHLSRENKYALSGVDVKILNQFAVHAAYGHSSYLKGEIRGVMYEYGKQIVKTSTLAGLVIQDPHNKGKVDTGIANKQKSLAQGEQSPQLAVNVSTTGGVAEENKSSETTSSAVDDEAATGELQVDAASTGKVAAAPGHEAHTVVDTVTNGAFDSAKLSSDEK
ncbi:hypothetical protein G7Y89_g3531 [Cudoniella acicularis]|uniref:Uncharacterized protein n=1 Tax=Cudoniella acicularis TaxID=354080 RepID=A0A8H4RU53_9HELO|nr:hypothetical protein G7Y89_g3531 [Cudoniella acicularis]